MDCTDQNVPQLSKIAVGATVSVITGIKFRYEGIVSAVNATENTITLQNVRFGGSETPATQTTELKGPAIGSVFESITFWMSNVIKLSILSEPESKTELTDNAVKNSCSVESATTTVKRPVTTVGDSQPSSRNSNVEVHNERRNNRGPRQFVYNPRRRNQGAPRQPYVAYNSSPAQMPASNARRYAFPQNELPPYIPTDHRQGRRGNINITPYSRDSNGGMYVYLPPEMAAVYRPQGMHVAPQAPFTSPRNNGRRRNYERRNVPARSSPNDLAKQPDYDFETANAELQMELAKLTINSENTGGRESPRQTLQIPSETGTNLAGKTSDSGASGDVGTAGIGGTDAESSTTADTGQALLRGEFYVREKCFFDQISRSEGGPRGPVSGPKTERSRFNHENTRYHGRPGNGPSGTTARRERQLNMETFGTIASRNAYNSRRRPPGSVSRNQYVSATA